MKRVQELPPLPEVGLQVVAEEVGDTGGFLWTRRRSLVLLGPDGSRSQPFPYYSTERHALDAVVVLPFFRMTTGEIWVVLRSAVRPPVALHDPEAPPGAEASLPVGFWEVPAGLIEPSEAQRGAILDAALRELLEETGVTATREELQSLGPVTFPCPGVLAERQYFYCVEIDPGRAGAPELDGSALEAAGLLVAVPLAAALRAARAGQVGDMKSELCLRRFAESVERR